MLSVIVDAIHNATGRDWKPPDWVKDSKGGRTLHDALELRTDLLANQSAAYVRQQLAVIRRHSQGCPIVFTVRTQVRVSTCF